MKQALPSLWSPHPLVIDDHDPRPRSLEQDWEEAVYPIGNGRLGGTLFGEPRRERLQFNADSLWVGNEHNTGAYQPFGNVYVEFAHDEYGCYRRALDIEQAVQTVRYESGGVVYRRECFASRPAQLIVMRITSDPPGNLSGRVSMSNVHELPITAEPDTLVMSGDTSQFWYWRWQAEDPERLRAGREFASDQNIDLDIEARVRVLHQGGETHMEDNAIVFTACDTLTLLLAADTNYLPDRSRGWRGEHPHNRICRHIAAAEQRTYDELLAEHIADYQSFFGRLHLDLGRTHPSIRNLPTAERVRRYAEQANAFRMIDRDPDSAEPIEEPSHPYRAPLSATQACVGWPTDRELEVLLYQYARYLLIASSSPGERVLPANLQGIWNISKRPPWRCDFHTDVNVQMNYWFSQASNLADCFPPLAHWIDSIREVRREETRRVLGIDRGWLTRAENGIFGGSTWFMQKGDSAWLCQNLWDHYAFTQDKAYLERYAYPVMKEICGFWLDHLKAMPDGTLVAPEGRSPEHGPADVDGVTYDQCLCWDLFNNTAEAARALGVDETFRQELRDKRDRLLDPQVGRWGQLQEWMEDIDDPEDDHRHVSHMIGVYPGRQIHPTTTPEFGEAARVGLIARRDHGPQHPGWSRVWKACLFARLLDAESAYGELVNVIAKRVYGNLWAVHPPFQIDANFGYAAGINEMLVQSHLPAASVLDDPPKDQEFTDTYAIHLLPALPAAWSEGKVTGLRARGGFGLDMTWREGQLVTATIRNLLDSTSQCVIRYDTKTLPLTLNPGEEHPLAELAPP